MKKKLLTLISIGLISISIGSAFAGNDSFDFRNSNWGDKRKEVMKAENAHPFRDTGEYLIYKTSFESMDCEAIFRFKKGKLYDALYRFEQQHNNDNDYIDDYNKAKKYLIEKYGTPLKDLVKWKDKTNENDKENWGTAIRKEHLKMYSEWRNERTSIVMEIYGNNSNIIMGIIYIPINASPEPKVED